MERYTLGYDSAALAFVSRRTADFHAAFFLTHLREGMQVLDVGCGPGSITAGIAARLGHGHVVGVDLSEAQVELASRNASSLGISNAEFRTGTAYQLPFTGAQFDAVFSHALLEHLREPVQAMREFLRVLKPGGIMAVATPDWGGFLFGPSGSAITDAIEAYKMLQMRNGGDVNIGHKLSGYAVDAGCADVTTQAYYENYQPVSIITDLLAAKLDDTGETGHARSLRDWAHTPHALFAEAWVSCLAHRPA